MTSPAWADSSSQSDPCPGCGAQMSFNPAKGLLSCSYCQKTVPLNVSSAPVLERDFEQWSGKHHTELAALSLNALEVDCPGCHAQITFEPPDIAGRCPFCSTHITAQPHVANPVITPESILPFNVDQTKAQQRLSKWLKTRWFAPDGLKQLAQHEGIQGVYLPFWTFDCHTRTHYTGERGTHYYVTKTRRVQNEEGKWVDETYQDCQTRWTGVSGQVQRFFNDLLVPAVESVKVAHLKQLPPWSLTQLVAYDPRFLSGFRVQRYQVSLERGFECAKQDMQGKINSDIRHDIGGDEQQIHSQSTTYQDRSFKHLLLPVWMATYRYQNQPYQVLINGETGKVVGDRPYSIIKIALAAGAAATAIALFLGIRILDNSTTPPSPFPIATPAITSVPPSSLLTPTNQPAAPGDLKLREAFSVATQAAIKTQTAQTSQAWQQVANLWVQAIETLKQIPQSDPRYNQAQLKIQEYQRNLNYARQRATQ